MNKRIDRRGPSWTEVFLGALLSLVLGVIIGALLLILRPVVVAKDTPKDIDPKVVYFIEGPRDPSKAAQALQKRKSFAEGQTVTVTDSELNALAAAASGTPGTPSAKPAEKAKAADAKAGDKPGAAATAGEMLAIGTANFRIAEDTLQVGVPVNVSVFGVEQKVIAQARGAFVKKDETFVYEPDALYLGSCPVQRLPYIADFVRNKLVTAAPIPDDIKASWAKLKDVTIAGNALKLTMP